MRAARKNACASAHDTDNQSFGVAKPTTGQNIPCCSCPASSALAFHIESNNAVGPNGVASPLYAYNAPSADILTTRSRKTDLDKRRIHLTSHTFSNTPRQANHLILFPRLVPPLGFACAPGMALVEKVLFEEWVVEECLENCGKETCL